MKTRTLFFIYALLSFTSPLVAQEGTIDLTFGIQGKISNNFGTNNQAYGSALQSDGKIIAVGNTYSYAPGSSFLTVRYLEDGSLDKTFGTNGYTTTLVGDHCSAQSVSIQDDGKIVVAGTTYAPSGNILSTDIMIVRYNKNGTLDTSFDTDGIKVVNLNNTQTINSLLIQPDGKIIVGGDFTLLTNSGLDTFGLARFNTDGSIDTTFGSNGYVYTPNIYRGEIRDMKFLKNGDIIAVGRGFISSTLIMAKYNSNGQVINSFGANGNGVIEEAYNQIALFYKCIISSNDDIYVAGATYNGTKYNAFITKYNLNGVIDNSFGVNGKILKDFGKNVASFANDINIDYNNNLIVGYGVGPTNNYDFGLESYNLKGELNTSFGNNGYFTTNFGDGHDYFSTLVIQPDNKIVMIGDKGNQIAVRINNSKSLSTNDLNQISNKINISPNPVKDYSDLTLHLKNSAIVSVDLYGINGNLISTLIKDKSFPEGATIEKLTIARENLPQGMYFLKLIIDGKPAQTLKMLKL